MNNEVEVFIEKIRENAILPVYANPYDAGMDVFAACDLVIKPQETGVVPTGLKFAIPNGYEIQVRPRSGISLKTPLRVSNSPGTIDSGYRGELGIIITNTSESICKEDVILSLDTKNNQKGIYQIHSGDRIAQIVLKEVPRMKLSVVASVDTIGSDRGGGFGSTGVR